MMGVDVEFKPKSGKDAKYKDVDLISGVTVLTDPSQFGFTIDATNDNKKDLGDSVKIKIDNDKEKIRTKCDTPFVIGAPAPLDKPKGDPSPNWVVVAFVDKDSNTGGPGTPPIPGTAMDACEIVAQSGQVTYSYTITNTGVVDVTNVTVSDDILGTVSGSPIALIPVGQSVTLTATTQVSADVTNIVTVVGEAGPNMCDAVDSVTVTVRPPPDPFECDKPIDVLTMIWDGTQPIRIKAYKGNTSDLLLADIDNIMVGDEVTVSGFTGSPNDMFWKIFEAGTSNRLGESVFHMSCSDDDMDDPEDCGKREGNSKNNNGGFINDWLLEGMIGAKNTLD